MYSDDLEPRVVPTPNLHLGLALVVRLVAVLGGTIDIKSEPNAGTTVQVTIPPLSRDTSTAEPPSQLSA